MPSWCDRILVAAWEGAPLVQQQYNAAFELMTSDHSPVFSVFKAGILRPFVPKSTPSTCRALLVLRLPSRLRSEATLVGIYDLYARDLLAKDTNGYSDPFIKFKGSFLVRFSSSSFFGSSQYSVTICHQGARRHLFVAVASRSICGRELSLYVNRGRR